MAALEYFKQNLNVHELDRLTYNPFFEAIQPPHSILGQSRGRGSHSQEVDIGGIATQDQDLL